MQSGKRESAPGGDVEKTKVMCGDMKWTSMRRKEAFEEGG